MAGHNKWSKVKNVKGKEDAKRAKEFTKLSRMLMVVSREGGSDPLYNSALNMAIEKAKAANMPNDNIERAIKKGAGEIEGQEFEEITYEGYGPQGVAILVECLTDNKNRTASNVRHAFDKFGGNLGTSGSVSYLFDYKGIFVLEDQDFDEEEVFMNVLEAGGEDVKKQDGIYLITAASQDFAEVLKNLEEVGYQFQVKQLGYLAKTKIDVSDEEAKENLESMIEMLEEDDDVQEVYTTWADF